MEICELESVCAVYRHKSYAEAAYHLFISPTTVSKHILRVEEEFGAQLFERATKTRPAALSPLGEAVIGDIQLIVDTYHKVKQATKAADAAQKTLTIGYSPLIGSFGETDIFYSFITDNPDVVLMRRAARNSELISMISSRTVEGAFISTLGEDPFAPAQFAMLKTPEYDVEQVTENRRLHIVVAEDHPLAKYDMITREMFPLLRDETFIFAATPVTALGNRSRSYIQRLFGLEGKMKCAFIDLTDREVALRVVRGGGGILPQACRITNENVEGVRFLPIEGWNTPARLYFVSMRENAGPELASFKKTVAKFIEK